MLTGRKLPLTLWFVLLVSLAAGVSCDHFFTDTTITSFVIKPSSATVPLGGTFQMHAFGTDSNNNPTGDITNKITWTSNESGSVSVDASTPGLLHGVALSTTAATITGAYQALSDQTATATVCVENGTNFAISPNNGSITSGQSPKYTASTVATVNSTQKTVDITSAVQWSTSSSTILSITSGTDPAVGTTTSGTTGAVVVTASYTCNGVTNTFTTNFTVN